MEVGQPWASPLVQTWRNHLLLSWEQEKLSERLAQPCGVAAWVEPLISSEVVVVVAQAEASLALASAVAASKMLLLWKPMSGVSHD